MRSRAMDLERAIEGMRADRKLKVGAPSGSDGFINV
jgi:hypothetical protein